jgi:hypothetical protein
MTKENGGRNGAVYKTIHIERKRNEGKKKKEVNDITKK